MVYNYILLYIQSLVLDAILKHLIIINGCAVACGQRFYEILIDNSKHVKCCSNKLLKSPV